MTLRIENPKHIIINSLTKNNEWKNASNEVKEQILWKLAEGFIPKKAAGAEVDKLLKLLPMRLQRLNELDWLKLKHIEDSVLTKAKFQTEYRRISRL